MKDLIPDLWVGAILSRLEANSKLLPLFGPYASPPSFARRIRWRLRDLRERCERAIYILRYGYDKYEEG